MILSGSLAIWSNKGMESSAKWDHPIARMAFFGTYQTLGIATENMGITPEGRIAIEQMQKLR
jgi:methylmalonyl-CoA/ethylmalonyl-CoA epimerase